MSTTSKLSLLLERRSTPSRLLGAPAPTEVELRALVEAATRVPDHGRLQPWRLIAIQGDARAALGRALVALREARGEALDAPVRDKDLHRFNHAPLILVVVARLTTGHKVPEVEQLLSAGAVAQNLLIGAQALGYGAQWLTGWAAYDAGAQRLLGLAEHERIVAFVHLGTAQSPAPDRDRPSYDELMTEWCAADMPAL
jgi:nitroreductase